MTITALRASSSDTEDDASPGSLVGSDRRDLQQTCRLILATAWLFDAVLQIQPFMFGRGAGGFSGTLHAGAAGNPSWIAQTITWNASIVDHHRVLTNSLFASVQFLIGFGIAWKRTSRHALALSIAWAIAVWWFGEGLGGVLHGRAIPLGGGPGGVLFYGLVAVLLWPPAGSDEPFIAARAVGVAAARIIWTMVWSGLAVLSIVGSGRSPAALRGLVAGMEGGEPGWLTRLDRWTASFLHDHGSTVSISLAVASGVFAVSVYLPPRSARILLGLALVLFVVIWVTIQNFGGILTGRATDPDSAPIIVLLTCMYWPLTTRPTALRGPIAVGARQ